jgi:hypothetical protein
VETDAHVPSLHVACADDEHGVDFGLFGVLDFAVDFVRRIIAFHADEVGAEFGRDRFGVVHLRLFIVEGEDADLFGSASQPAPLCRGEGSCRRTARVGFPDCGGRYVMRAPLELKSARRF